MHVLGRCTGTDLLVISLPISPRPVFPNVLLLTKGGIGELSIEHELQEPESQCLWALITSFSHELVVVPLLRPPMALGQNENHKQGPIAS